MLREQVTSTAKVDPQLEAKFHSTKDDITNYKYAYLHKSTGKVYVPKDGKQEASFTTHVHKAKKWDAWSAIPPLIPLTESMSAYHRHKVKVAVGAPRLFSKKERTPRF